MNLTYIAVLFLVSVVMILIAFAFELDYRNDAQALGDKARAAINQGKMYFEHDGAIYHIELRRR